MIAHSGHVMTLANSIIGVGILAMPFCFQKCGILLSVVLLIVSNWITRICCHYLIKSSLLTRRKSMEFLGFHAFGSSGKLVVELCIIGYLIGTCITYFVVVGDLGPQIVREMFTLEPGHRHLRTIIMIAVTLICILPLGMLKNVDSLSTVFTASIGFYFCLVLKVVLESQEQIIANDWTQKVVYWEPSGVLQCLPIFSMALSCQMQLFEVCESVHNQSLEKLNGIVRNATWICTIVYISVGFFGYVAFCTQTFTGNILMNFSTSFGSDVIKIGFIMSVAFSFPLVIFPCRASIYSLLYRKGHMDASGYIPESRFKAITVIIVGISLCIALMIPSVELIIGLVGSTIGVAIAIIFPAICFRKIVRKESTERTLAQLILVSGLCLMILGTYANLNAIDEQRSGSHLEAPKVNEDILRELHPIVLSSQAFSKGLEDKLKEPKIDNDFKIVVKQTEILNDKNTQNGNKEKVEENPPLMPVEESRKEPQLNPKADTVDGLQSAAEILNLVQSIDEEKHEKKPILTVLKPAAKSSDKLEVISSMPHVPIDYVVSSIVDNTDNKKPSKPVPVYLSGVVLASASPVPQLKNQANNTGPSQRNIDGDAIKKDEEIAAEEQKSVKDTNADQLKKTQNELKETKELLERTVGELKQEIAKQTIKTQNLVVEKLGEVVEKVEQIERKVQKSEAAPQEPAIVVPIGAVKEITEEEPKMVRKTKGSLLSILSENAHVPALEPKTVYEPLSYKTGELMEQLGNSSKPDQRLSLPLALLINASQAKMNATLSGAAEKETNGNLKQNQDYVKSIVPLPIKKDNKTNQSSDKAPETEKENVEAIRRDLLQVDISKIAATGTTLTPNSIAAQQRIKRSADDALPLDFEAINSKLEKENCLTEPKLDALLTHSKSGAVDFTIFKGITRDLKALKEDEET